MTSADTTPRSAARLLALRGKGARSRGLGERLVRSVLALLAVLPTLALAALAYEIVRSAYPAIVFNGWHFFSSKTFTIGNLYGGALQVRHGIKAPQGASYGVLPLLFGTVVSSFIALLFAVPVAVGGAMVIAEKLPQRFQGLVGMFLELLAGIPSVIFGLWGVYTFGPFLSRTVDRWIAALHIPWLTGAVGAGQGLFTASLVLAVMVTPIIGSITRELIRSIPVSAKEGAVAMGLTPWETAKTVTIPYIRGGVVAASILGLARALGETIAVLVISGNLLNAYPSNIFSPFSTMASTIAAFLDAALTDSTGMAVHSLAEVALVLLVITLVANLGGRLLANKFSSTGLPVGRGV